MQRMVAHHPAEPSSLTVIEFNFTITIRFGAEIPVSKLWKCDFTVVYGNSLQLDSVYSLVYYVSGAVFSIDT